MSYRSITTGVSSSAGPGGTVTLFLLGMGLLVSGVGAVAAAADGEADSRRQEPVPTLLARRGSLLLDDDGSIPRGPKENVTLDKGIRLRAWAGKWGRSPDSTAWRSTWAKGMGHTPVASYSQLRAKNLIVEVTFRYGVVTEPWHTQSFRIALDDRPRITGHIVSAWANPNNDFIETGFLLQHIHKKPDKTILKDLLLDHQPIQVEPGTWYTAALEVVEDEALFRMGKHVAYAKAEEIRASKNLVSLTFGTAWHEVKRVRIWEAEPHPDWPKKKATVLESRKEFAPVPHNYQRSP